VALTLIALILGLFAIRIGAAFFIPLLLSLFLNYALSPVVGRLASWGVPRAVGAALVILAFGAAITGALYRVGSDAGDVLQEIPSAVQRLRIAITRAQQDHTGALEHVQRTASELQKLAEAASPAPARPKQPAAAGSGVDISWMLLIGTSNIAIALGQLASALFLAFFLLSAGDLFRRKFLRAVGGDFSRRKMTLRILDGVDRQNQRYFAIVLLVNIAVGYGGRREIADAVRALLHEHATRGTTIEELAEVIDVEHIAQHLYTKGQPDPDLVIRTSGEQRLGGFLLWQSAHSEFYFCEAYWPAFRRVDFLRAVRAYAQRERRFGS